MELKPTITKTLNDRKTVLRSKADAIRASLEESDNLARAMRKELETAESEIADIDEFLSTPEPALGVSESAPQKKAGKA